MVEHYSHKIQNVIQKELFKAQKSIKIAVAWFTNDLLFQPLLLKLQAGVSVELILNKDEINDSAENEIDFNTFVEVGGVLHWNTTKTLMHEKFCIIDDSVVIYGSYNWTNKAEYNDESIAVSKDEFQTLNFYSKLFEELSNRYPVASKNNANYPNKHLSDFEEAKQESNIRPETSYEVDLTIFEDSRVKIARCKSSIDGSRAYYIIDVTSNEIISNKYEKCDTAGRSLQERSPLIALKNEGQCFFYDTRKHIIIKSYSYDDIKGSTSNPVFFVCHGNKWGIVDVDNKLILKVEYDQIEDFKKQTYSSKYSFNGYLVKKNSKYGVFADGKFVFDCIYDKLCLDGENPSMLNGKQGLIDRNGEVIVDFDYDEIEYQSQIRTVYDKSCGPFYLLRKRNLYGVYLIDYAYTNGCLTPKPDNLIRYDVFRNMGIEYRECYKFVQSLLNHCYYCFEQEKSKEFKLLFNKRRSGEIVSIKDKLQSKRTTIAAFYNDENSLKVAKEALEKIQNTYPKLRTLLCDVKENSFLLNGLSGYSIKACPCLALMCNGYVLSFWNGRKALSDWIIFDMFKSVSMADKYR